MATILSVETATHGCSAALLHRGEVFVQRVWAPREHAARILGMVDEVLRLGGADLGDLDAIAFGVGPGSFLGTRIAAGVAQGIGFARDLPLIPVSSLSALAECAYAKVAAKQVVVAWDARMKSIYWGSYIYEAGLMQAAGADQLSQPGEMSPPQTGEWLLVGNAWDEYQQQLAPEWAPLLAQRSSQLRDAYPQAEYLLPAAQQAWEDGKLIAAEDAGPIYLRDPVRK